MKMAREKRAKIYFRLMDITLLLAVMGFAEFLLDKVFGIILIQTSNPIYPAVSAFFVVMNFLMPMFLLMARFMRDEYAELLWRRTAVVFAYALAVAPFLLWGGVWASYLLTGKRTSEGVLSFMAQSTQPLNVIFVVWMVFMLLFIAIFQFLRWRDER